MNVLVTGATGRVGSRLVPRLLAHGEAVRVLVRDRSRATVLSVRGADVVEGDLRDGHSLRRALDEMDAVIHLAAAFRGVSEDEAMAVNVGGSVALGNACASAGVSRFVFASTNLVYGPGRGRPAREDDEPAADAANVYPRTKVAAERGLVELHETAGLDLRVLRLAFVYGDGDPHLAEAPRWTQQWPPEKRLHLVHHADVAQACLRALRVRGLAGATFNIADDAPITTFEVLELNGEEMSLEARSGHLDDPWEGIVDGSLARSELGLRPIYPSIYSARDAGAL